MTCKWLQFSQRQFETYNAFELQQSCVLVRISSSRMVVMIYIVIYIYIDCPSAWKLRTMHYTNRCYMMTSSNGNIFRVTGPLCGESQVTGEFPSLRPVTRSFDVFFDLCLSKQLSEQSTRWWFETPSHSLFRHCSETSAFCIMLH